MEFDLPNRVRHTRLKPIDCLLPLFEAISNSIYAIEEGASKFGRIDITIVRDRSEGLLKEGQQPIGAARIREFVVEDNGVGFTAENYQSFITADSARKASKGGKGVGRLMWLKAFDRAEIESHFEESGAIRVRTFAFSCSKEGVGGNQIDDSPKAHRRTRIRLIGFKKEYEEVCPKAAGVIARRLIQHFLKFFALESCPRITLHDPDGHEGSIVLNDYFRQQMLVRSARETFKINKHEFECHHVLINAVGMEKQHRVVFCADLRVAQGFALTENLVPNLTFPIRDQDEGKSMVYFAYISGKFLDANSSTGRTSIDLIDHLDLPLPDEVSRDDLERNAVLRASNYLTPLIEPIRAEKRRQIEHYVTTEAPQYRPLLKHRSDWIDSIPPNLGEERLDIELYKLDHRYSAELREQSLSIKVSDKEKAEDEEYRETFKRFSEEWNEHGMSRLAQYVAFRKATISILDDRLGVRDDGKFQVEETIHRLVFPLKRSSDDARPEQMNLWLIDERLAYHHYLASDVQLDRIEPVEIDGKERPDLLIFNHSFAFADGPPFGSIVLIEFKRPERSDYTDDENPIDQIYEYVSKIKSGKAKDRRGRTIRVPENIPFHAYIICDLTPNLVKRAGNGDYTMSPDSLGYYHYHKNHGVYVEIISFDKMVMDAKKRNAVLFDKLGMPCS